ncbi:MAG: DUF294 nucleotidyltransferase-like domain-containing protein, partial [Pseudomonadota bacterium]
MTELELKPSGKLKSAKERLIIDSLMRSDPGFLEQHSKILDDYFRECFTISDAGPLVRIDQNPCALLALGGYGRKEQSLNSDIDILFLFEKAVPEETNALIQ